MKHLINLFIVILFFSSCNFEKPEDSKFEDNLYSNSFFDFSLQIPKDWTFVDTKQLTSFMVNKMQANKSEDEINNLLKTSRYLFSIQKNINGEFYNIVALAEDIKDSPNISSLDYLKSARYKVKDYNTISELYYVEKLGTVDFDVTYIHLENQKFCSKYYATLINGYCLVFIMNFDCSDEMQSEMMSIIDKIKFNQKQDVASSNQEVQNSDSQKEKGQYFKVVSDAKVEFLKDKGGLTTWPTFSIKFDVLNNTDYKCNVSINSTIYIKYKDGSTSKDEYLRSSLLENGGIDPNPSYKIENWNAKDTREITQYTSYDFDYSRTPEEIFLRVVFDIYSVELEAKEYHLGDYDLLPDWKNKQKELGLR